MELVGEYFHSALIVEEGVYIYNECKRKENMRFKIFCLVFSFSLVNAKLMIIPMYTVP